MSKLPKYHPDPPKLAIRFLRWYCHPELVDEVEGDLYELFRRRAEEQGLWKAKILYWLNVLMFLHPDYIRKRKENYSPNHITMLRIHFVLAWRNLLKKKLYSFINMSSLTIGLTGSILIFLYVQHELSFDHHHSKKDRIYRILERSEKLGISSAILPGVALPFLEEISGIEKVTRINGGTEDIVTYQDQTQKEDGFWFADPEILRILDYTFLAGDAATALNEPASVIITESTARRYFYDQEAIGKIIRYDHQIDLTVTGVITDIPETSHFTFDFLAPMVNMQQLNPSMIDRWDNQSVYYFCLLSEDSDVALLQQQIEDAFLENNPRIDERALAEIKELDISVYLQPLTAIHLYSSDTTWDYARKGDIAYVIGFSIVSLLLLCIACFNFVNLTTANASQRAKEIGIKKTMGARRSQLMGQFYSETLLFTLVALLLSLFATHFLLPYFNQMMATSLTLSLLNVELVGALFTLAGLVFILAGSYPALFLSSMQPIKSLKGLSTPLRAGSWLSSQVGLRHILVVGQFGVAIALIISSFFVASQLRLMMEGRLGFDQEQLMVINNPWDQNRVSRLEAFKRMAESSSQIVGVASAQNTPVGYVTNSQYVRVADQPEEENVLMGRVAVSHGFIEVMRANLIAGRNFSPTLRSDSTAAVIVNQTAVRKLGLDQPVGQFVVISSDTIRQVVGVIEDIQFASLHEEAQPVVFYIDPARNTSTIIVRTYPGELSGTVAMLQDAWEQLAPEWPFQYQFVDERLQQVYQAELQTQQLVRVFTLLTVLISCLGLFGLATLTTERRVKEIGIRKVLGASVQQLVLLLSRDFTRWVVLAFIVACPLAYFAVRFWLQNFAERVSIAWWVFGLSGLLAIVIAWLTISYQSVRAALANPVDSLRNE